MTTQFAVDLEDMLRARARLSADIHRTPVLTSTALDRRAGRQLFWKCENFQKVGAFKFRGALNAVRALDDRAAAHGVVTHSSGNHAQALALAAQMRGIPAHVVMPITAPAIKRDAVLGYGARVIPCEPTLEAREQTAARVQEETGATLIPPFDHPDVIAGQGTIALELLEQVDSLDAVIVPVGGGGLISGVSLALREAAPNIAVVGAEPANVDDAARSKREGIRLGNVPLSRSIADGLLTSLGALTWPVVRDVVREVRTVSELEIVEALHTIFQRLKVVIEPSSAVAAAVALSTELPPPYRRVAVVLSGGNIDTSRIPTTESLALDDDAKR